MKRNRLVKRLLLLFSAILISNLAVAQQTVSGTVVDANDGMGIPGVTVVEKGTNNGTITDLDGNYTISTTAADAVLVFSYIGYKQQEVPVTSGTVNVDLVENTEELGEVVIIGYGEQKKDDATGSVTAIGAEDFNKGAITSPQDLLVGRTAGVQITTGGGAPGSGATIRIRGGSSLSASNDPLIVIDGVPIDTEGVAGMRNPLNTIHPNDIESFTVLKDASATAIYGSRASNGVIIITTKKGREGSSLKLNYTGNYSYYTIPGTVDVLDAEQYKALINERYADNPDALALLGTENTNWQEEIMESSFGHDHNISATGAYKNLPYRVSLGYSDQAGILKTSELQRTTLAVGLNPTFLDDHLQVNVNMKGMMIDNRFADKGAIGAAVAFDPTQPVNHNYDGDLYGGYYTWTQEDGTPIPIATDNPVAMLQMKEDLSTVMRGIGNAQFDYKLHFLPDMRANLNVGYDYSKSEGTVFVPQNAPMNYNAQIGGGQDKEYEQEKKTELIDFYLNYTKDLAGANSKVDVMAGYSWQHFWRKGYDFETNIPLNDDVANLDTIQDTDYETESYLVSFFGRMNYTFADRYLLTFTVRQDGSSRFAEDNRWGLFPSAAFAWKINRESFLANSQVVSDLKLRIGYGVTGQQNITDNNYPYLARYTYSETTAQYMFGNQYVTTLRPEGYDANLKWEETTTYNIGLDFGFFDDRLMGSIDAYSRETKDLINTIPVPAGTNLTNRLLTNVGNLENRGVEIALTGRPVVTNDLFWEITANATFNENEITKLTASDDSTYNGVEVGGIDGGVGNNIQIHSVGFPSSSFYVYEQVYDEEGNPIEGLYVDRNGDGMITTDDKYRYEKPAPDVTFGFGSRLTYKNWDFSFTGRASIGNYVYDNISSNKGIYSTLLNQAGYLNNIATSALDINFVNPRYHSDYYVKNASFLRLDNISLGYQFTNILADKLDIHLSATVQNVFVVTEYEGLDPEIDGGIDNNIYPRPRTFIFGISIDF